MIVLRIRLDGVTMDHRLERGHATLGSAGRSTIRATSAGWPPLAATLVQDGTEVRMIVPGRAGTLTLRVGDEVRLGRADIALIGLLPAETDASAPVSATAPPTVATTVSAPPPEFGEYESRPPFASRLVSVEPPGTPRFVLADSTADAAANPVPGPQRGPTVAARGAPTSPPKDRDTASLTASSATAANATSSGSEASVPFSFDPQQDFGTELLTQLKRTPWLACSVAFHVLLFLVFSVFFRPPQGGATGGRHSIEAGMLPAELHSDAGPEASDERAAPEALPESTPIPDTPAHDDDQSAPEAEPHLLPGPAVADEQPVPDMGTLPTISAAGRKTAPRPSSPKSTAPKVDLQEAFVKSSVRDATRRAAQHVRDQLGMDKGGPGDALKALEPEDVMVIEGAYDHQERVLADLQVPHHEISPYDPRLASGVAFERPRFVFWNCGDPLNPRLLARITPRVRAFVERGGYLFTSDWALDNVVKPAFPGYVESQGTGLPLPEMVLEIAPTRAGTSHQLLEGVFQPGVRGRWWLEKLSHDIVVKKPSEVTVLIESPQLRELLNRSPVMACTFPYGKGRVLHILGHYYQEEGNLAGAVAAQRIALNFVLMGIAGSK